MKEIVKAKMGCNLIIDTEEDNPSTITRLIGVEASEVMIKGTPFISPFSKKVIPQKRNRNNLWMFKPEKMFVTKEGVYLETAVETTLSILDKNKEAFIEVINRFSNSKLLCYCYYYDEYNPYFFFSQKLIARLNEYNLPVEFDLYLLKNDE